MTTERLLLNGAPAHVEVHGSGNLPLLLVGGAVPPGWADGIVTGLSPLRRVIYFDYRPPPNWPGNPEARTQVQLGRDALAVLDALDIDVADVLGYSRGAVAAYAAAFASPSRVRSLILLAPVAPFADMLIEPTPPMPDGDPASVIALLTRAAFSDEFIEARPDDAAAMTEAVMRNEATIVRVAREHEEAFPEDPRIDQPTLVITAESDRLVDPAHSIRLVTAIPGAHHAVIRGGSHLVAWERPTEVTPLIESFLAPLGT